MIEEDEILGAKGNERREVRYARYLIGPLTLKGNEGECRGVGCSGGESRKER